MQARPLTHVQANTVICNPVIAGLVEAYREQALFEPMPRSQQMIRQEETDPSEDVVARSCFEYAAEWDEHSRALTSCVLLE